MLCLFLIVPQSTFICLLTHFKKSGFISDKTYKLVASLKMHKNMQNIHFLDILSETTMLILLSNQRTTLFPETVKRFKSVKKPIPSSSLPRSGCKWMRF